MTPPVVLLQKISKQIRDSDWLTAAVHKQVEITTSTSKKGIYFSSSNCIVLEVKMLLIGLRLSAHFFILCLLVLNIVVSAGGGEPVKEIKVIFEFFRIAYEIS